MADKYNHTVEAGIDGIISHVELPNNGGIYEIHDPKAVHNASELGIEVMRFVGSTATSLTDGDTTDTILLGDGTHTALTGDVVLSNGYEFVWVGDKWEQLGQEGSFSLKTHTHQVTCKPEGEVSQPTFDGEEITHNHEFEGDLATITVTYTPEGEVSAPALSGSVTSRHLSIRALAPTFTGTQDSASTNYKFTGTVKDTAITPKGTVSKPTFSGTTKTHETSEASA